MKANVNNLERLLRKMIRGQEVSPADLLFHWKGLERRGNRIVITVLNRQHAWDRFVRWAVHDPLLRGQLESLADLAGITQSALETLQGAGISATEGETSRTRALWIAEVAAEGKRLDWGHAGRMMLEDPDLMEGVLGLLEELPNQAVSAFLTTLLEERLNPVQDHGIRKVLYHFRQRGLKPETEPEAGFAPREIFCLGENLLPLWQPILYFRSHSVFSDRGDLYVLQLQEGRDFETSEQQRDIRLDSASMQRLADQYTSRLKDSMGLEIPFRIVPSSHARYFLQRSAACLPGERGIHDFLKFIGEGAVASPIETYGEVSLPADQASLVMAAPYFANWLIDPEDLSDFFTELEKLEQGPIILTEGRLQEQRHATSVEALRKYFDPTRCAVWSLAFEKAAFFLKDSDSERSQSTLGLSRALANPRLPIEDIPAAALLFERTLAFVVKQKKAQQEQEKRTSLIMSPQEFQRQYKGSKV